MRNLLVVTIGLAWLAGCSEPVGPAFDPVVFVRENLGGFDDLRPPAATAEGRSVQVSGSFIAFCSGPWPVGEIDIEDETILISVSFSSPAEPGAVCLDAPQPFTYSAGIGPLGAGDYTLVIHHSGEYTGDDGEVFRGQFRIE